jgi:F-type H+-transporting ATPase subunit b
MSDPLKNPEVWVLIAFLVFVGILLYVKVPAALAKGLDERAAAIAKELDEAKRLREEAQQILADYKRKTAAADAEAKAIVEEAKREAEAMAAETKKGLAESVERRTKLAEDKIARAEAQALSEVRATAVEAAIVAAERILKSKVSGEMGSQLIAESIRDLKSKLN